MKRVEIEAYLEYEILSLSLFQDEDDEAKVGDPIQVGPLLYWDGNVSCFEVVKPREAEKLVVTFSYDPAGKPTSPDTFPFVQKDDAFIGYALNDVYVNIMPAGRYHVEGVADANEPSLVTVRFTPA